MGLVWQRVEPLLRPGVNKVRDRRVSPDEGHGYCLDGNLAHGPSQVGMQATPHWQDQVALLNASARSSYQLPLATGSRHEVRYFIFLSP